MKVALFVALSLAVIMAVEGSWFRSGRENSSSPRPVDVLLEKHRRQSAVFKTVNGATNAIAAPGQAIVVKPIRRPQIEHQTTTPEPQRHQKTLMDVMEAPNTRKLYLSYNQIFSLRRKANKPSSYWLVLLGRIVKVKWSSEFSKNRGRVWGWKFSNSNSLSKPWQLIKLIASMCRLHRIDKPCFYFEDVFHRCFSVIRWSV